MIYTTIGGVTIGLSILGWVLIQWWPGRKALMKKPLPHLSALLPFAVAWCYGALGTLATMGFIGWSFDTALWASNWIGDAALWFGVGERVGQAAQGVTTPLTTFGNCALVLMTVCMIAAVKFTPAGPQMKLGVWCGLCLGTSSSVAGLAAVPLAEAVNAIGSVVYAGAT